ncbi:uncharacterized protein LOC113346383 [Papaver somniferum]|uniref:uncharacterized protein LOC113346383 n=1 Tax=Papaver somniferum TaxID=3469 RepID=UPI000E704E85|nr:uncharacterized protein LOC113346383 [Papaver somniferum]
MGHTPPVMGQRPYFHQATDYYYTGVGQQPNPVASGQTPGLGIPLTNFLSVNYASLLTSFLQREGDQVDIRVTKVNGSPRVKVTTSVAEQPSRPPKSQPTAPVANIETPQVYDHKNDDYKFALGVELRGSIGSTLIQVYTLSSNSWKTEKTMPYWFCQQTAGVLVNGDLHWLVMAQSDFTLLSLDISDEIFNEMQLPEELLEKDEDMSMVLGVLEGSLCALVSSYINDVKIGYEVWEMLDYGVQESWTKLHVIAHESIISANHYFRLVWSSKNGDILLLSRRSLVLYDPKHGSAREIKINARFLDTDSYFESLVSLNSGTYVGTEDD